MIIQRHIIIFLLAHFTVLSCYTALLRIFRLQWEARVGEPQDFLSIQEDQDELA
jgi:hypothetical protein